MIEIVDIFQIITGFIAATAALIYVWMWMDKHIKPIKIEDLSGKEIKIKIINNTGERIFVAPRDFELDGERGDKPLKLYPDIKEAVTGVRGLKGKNVTSMAQRNSLPFGSIYCQFPASTDPTTSRGLWACRLDSKGLDKQKNMTTERLPIYKNIISGLINKELDRLESVNSSQRVNQVNKATDKLVPESLLQNSEGAKEATLKVEPYYKLYFKKGEGGWELTDRDPLFLPSWQKTIANFFRSVARLRCGKLRRFHNKISGHLLILWIHFLIEYLAFL